MKWEFFVPLISFFGLVAGIILARISPEEMKQGKKFFKVMRLAVLFMLIVMLLYYSNLNLLMLAIGLSIGFFIRLGYLYMGVSLAGALLASRDAFFMIASLVFIYGLPYGTLLESRRKINVRKLLLSGMTFAAPFFILLFPLEPSYILSLCAGLLVGQIKDEF